MLRADVMSLICASALLTACATLLPPTSPVAVDIRQPADLAECDSRLVSDRNMQTAMVVNLIDQERFYAALARLDALPQDTAYIRYLRAHALRQLDRGDEAETLYEELVPTCMDGYAHHGLGLLAARRGAIETAHEHLTQARKRLPLDPRVRNDHGYVLLLARQPVQAYSEFMTALELNAKAQQPKYNALLTLLLLERKNQARVFAERMELSNEDIERAMDEAQRISHGWSQSRQPVGREAGESEGAEALSL